MKIITLFLPLLFFISCQNADPNRPPKKMSTKDSTLYMKLWLGQMKKENFNEMIHLNPPPGLTVCFIYVPLTIKVNRRGQIMIREKIGAGFITSTITHYLTQNINRNERGNNSPLYGRTSLEDIKDAIESNLKRLQEGDVSNEVMYIKKAQIAELKIKRKVLKTLGAKELAEINGQSFIQYEMKKGSKINYSVSDSVFLTHFSIRDSLSKVHFKEPYLEIYRRHLIFKDSIDKDKLDALKVLMPIRYIDWPNLNKYRHVEERNMILPRIPPTSI